MNPRNCIENSENEAANYGAAASRTRFELKLIKKANRATSHTSVGLYSSLPFFRVSKVASAREIELRSVASAE